MLRWSKSKSPEGEAQKPAAAGAGAQPRAAAPRPAPAAQRPAHAAGPAVPRKSLPQLLLEEGKVSQEQLDRLLAKQKETGAFIGELLVEEGISDEQSLISFLAKYCKIPHLSLLDYLIEPAILELIPQDVCLQYRLLPIDKLGSNLTVAMVNPLDAKALDKVREICPDLRIKPILCAYKHFEAVTAKAFKNEKTGGARDMSASSFGLVIPKAKPAPEPEAAAPPPAASEPAASAPAPAAKEASREAPRPEASAPKPASDAPRVDSDALVDGVFRQVGEHAPPEEPPEASGMDSFMEEVTSVMMDSMRDTYAMLARRMELFNGLKPEDVAKIFARGDTVEFEPEQIIFRKGDPGDHMYIVLGGAVRIFDGDKEYALLDRGDMFGEMALVSSELRSASAQAVDSTSLLVLSIDVIRDVMPREVSVQLLVNIVVTLSKRLREANTRWDG